MKKSKIALLAVFSILFLYFFTKDKYFADSPLMLGTTSNEASIDKLKKEGWHIEKPDITYNCTTDGGEADDTGLKVWCWGDITLPEYSGKKGTAFSDGELVIDSECNEKQVTKVGNQLKFSIDPQKPKVGSWCSNIYNMRAEIRTAPWKIRHKIGTEEWFGWSYTFGKGYIIDKASQWMFFQVHEGTIGSNPLISLQIINANQFKEHKAGEIYVVNSAKNPGPNEFVPTNIIPESGQTMDIIVHVIWGEDTTGLLQVWIDEKMVYNRQTRTVFASNPVGGNAKWGIYKWPWRKTESVQASKALGITNFETFMGPLRMITRKPQDPDYGKNSYATVAPR